MRLLILTQNMDPKNGGGRYALELVSGLRKAGLEVSVAKEHDDGYEGNAVLARGWGIFTAALRIRKLLNNVDIIHALDVYPYGIIAWLATRFSKKRFIITLQGSYSIAPFYNSKTRWLAKKTCLAASAIIAISTYTEKEFLKIFSDLDVVVINHGIDFARYQAERSSSPKPLILSVGALKFRKGYHIAIAAFARAKEKFMNLKYVIVGNKDDASYYQSLVRQAEYLGAKEDITFLEKVSDAELKKLYSQATLFLLPSVNLGHHFEGFGLVFLEAAAAGLPVIGTKNNGIADAVKDGYNGLLVEQNDIQSTARAILSLMKPEHYRQFSKNSYEWAKRNSIENMINKYLAVYNTQL